MICWLFFAHIGKFRRFRYVGVAMRGFAPCDYFITVYHALLPIEQEIFTINKTVCPTCGNIESGSNIESSLF
jgi:hypothetical protein